MQISTRGDYGNMLMGESYIAAIKDRFCKKGRGENVT